MRRTRSRRLNWIKGGREGGREGGSKEGGMGGVSGKGRAVVCCERMLSFFLSLFH